MSLYGQDILNALIQSVYNHHKNIIEDNQTSEDFVKITQIYSNFVLGACSLQKQSLVNLSYKKFKFILAKVFIKEYYMHKRINLKFSHFKIPNLMEKFEKSILNAQATSDSESPCIKLLFLGFILRFYHESTNTSSSFESLKVIFRMNITKNEAKLIHILKF